MSKVTAKLGSAALSNAQPGLPSSHTESGAVMPSWAMTPLTVGYAWYITASSRRVGIGRWHNAVGFSGSAVDWWSVRTLGTSYVSWLSQSYAGAGGWWPGGRIQQASIS